MGTPLRIPEVRSCELCGKPFEAGGRGRKPLRARFCSKSCSAQARVFSPVVPNLSVAEAAYIAAMIDGEGSIILMKRPPSVRLSLRVIVVNTDIGLMRWLSQFGGSVNTRSNINSAFTATPKPIHTWTVNGMNAAALLRQVIPYLIIKRDKAEIAIASQPVNRIVTETITLS